ncbi:MAG TPA: metallophosphoesterase, partial [Flavobacteriales bacterium]|nr:metallophosphoesterase [Flavobacteriales bacterium]
MSEIHHPPGCTCGNHDEQAYHVSRRQALKSLGALGAGLTLGPTVAMGALGDAQAREEIMRSPAIRNGKAEKFTILFTSDIHSQLHTHDEFFLENGKPVYKKRGGFGVLQTMIDTLRAEDPKNTLVIDGGDCFQGGGVAAKSEGRAIVPLMNRIGYDLILPGNWEVVYGKENMLKDLGGYRAAKVCANMWHEKQAEYCGTSIDPNADLVGEMIFQPYWTRIIAGIKIGFIGYNDPLTPKRQS